MKLYHSSNVSVNEPDTIHSRNFLDFGKGFYLTSLKEQAVKYALRFVRLQQNAWLKHMNYLSILQNGNCLNLPHMMKNG